MLGGDRYAGEWPRESLRAHGIHYDLSPKDKGALYLELVASLNSRALELPDDPVLLRELRSLERRRGPSGRDRVDHPAGAHDDAANAVAGLSCRALGAQSGLPTREELEDLLARDVGTPSRKESA